MKIYGFDNPEEMKEVQSAAENLLRKTSKAYKNQSDKDIARRRAERLTKENEERRNNTRRKPRM